MLKRTFFLLIILFLPLYSHAFAELPEFLADTTWMNSKALKKEDLNNKVLLINVWTYSCYNCYRSIPFINSVYKKFSDKKFEIIGVHTPEFPEERNPKNIIDKIKEYKIKYPVFTDNEFEYWRKLNNKYWPSFYIVNKQGKIVSSFIGETHIGDKRAKKIENEIQKLINGKATRKVKKLDLK